MGKLPKQIDSIRQISGTKKVVRLLCTKPLIDKRWVKGLKPEQILKYLVVRYDKTLDDYLPEWFLNERSEKVIWWEKSTHDKIKESIGGYDDKWKRQKKDNEKVVKARDLFMQGSIEQDSTDDWADAQDKYIDWCAEDGITVEKMRVGK